MSDAPASNVPEEYKGRVTSGRDWAEIVAWVGDLPPLPHVASQAIVLVEDPDTNAGQLTELLGNDAALAARVLKIANSAMFSCQREITTLNQAIMVIGFKALKGIIVAATLRQLNRRFGKLEKMIWENSTCAATAAYMLSQQLRKPYADEAFLLGLLHDLGKLVLVRQIPDDYAQVAELTKSGVTFNELEQERLGFSHALIGALVAKKWNFSAETCQVILHHHDDVETPFEKPTDEKTAVVQVADLIAHTLGFGHYAGYPDKSAELKTIGAKLGLQEADLQKVVEAVAQTFSDQSTVFN